jgi:hypothetical protein
MMGVSPGILSGKCNGWYLQASVFPVIGSFLFWRLGILRERSTLIGFSIISTGSNSLVRSPKARLVSVRDVDFEFKAKNIQDTRALGSAMVF